jgi:hypothetical protein
MSALASLSDLVLQLTTSGIADNDFFHKTGLRSGVVASGLTVGRWSSMWLYDGQPGGASALPTSTPDIPTNTTAGSIDPDPFTAGKQRWLLGATATCLTTGTVMLYDRLHEQAGLSATVTTPQTVSGTLTRYNTNSTCVGNQIWAEIYSPIGGTQTTISCIYICQDGTTKTSQSATFGGTGWLERDRMIPIPLASGDSGVQKVTSCTVTATTGTAGSFGITVLHPLTYVYITLAGVGSSKDLISGTPGVVEILPNACLAVAWYAGTTTAPQLFGSLHAVDK